MSQKPKDSQRQLSRAGLARKADFDALADRLAEQGYRKHDLTIGVIQTNLYAFGFALPIVAVLIVAFFTLHPINSLSLSFGNVFLVFVALFALIFVHEAIHGLVWGAFAKERWRSVSFGYMMHYLTP